MFKIIEAVNRSPVRFPLKPGIKVTKGNIAKIIDYQGTLVVDICDGYNAFGIIADRYIGGNEINYNSLVKTYPQRMIITLSKFDRINPIDIGCSLYSNFKGILSSKKPFVGAIEVAKVIEYGNKYISILWV